MYLGNRLRYSRERAPTSLLYGTGDSGARLTRLQCPLPRGALRRPWQLRSTSASAGNARKTWRRAERALRRPRTPRSHVAPAAPSPGGRRGTLVERFDIEPYSAFSSKRSNVKRLVLCCIDAKFCKKIFIGKLFTRSTRFSCFCTAQTSIFQKKIVKLFQIFSHFSAKFCEIYPFSKKCH